GPDRSPPTGHRHQRCPVSLLASFCATVLRCGAVAEACAGIEGHPSLILTVRQSRESVGTPLFTADAMVHKEQAVGIIFLLDGAQLRIIRSPVSLLPGIIEVVALRNIRTSIRDNPTQFRRGQINVVLDFACSFDVHRWSRLAGIRRSFATGDDY